MLKVKIRTKIDCLPCFGLRGRHAVGRAKTNGRILGTDPPCSCLRNKSRVKRAEKLVSRAIRCYIATFHPRYVA